MTKRIVDINGKMVHYPKHYMRSVNTGCKMIDAMERAGIDRSDMSVALRNMMAELEFHLQFLKNRTNK